MASKTDEVDGRRSGNWYRSIPLQSISSNDGDKLQEEAKSRRTDDGRKITVNSVCVLKLVGSVLFIVLACVVTGFVVINNGKGSDIEITDAAVKSLLKEIVKVEINLDTIIDQMKKKFTSITNKDRERFQMEFMTLNKTVDKSIKLVQKNVDKVGKGLNEAFEDIENIERILNATTHRYSTVTVPISTVTMTTTPIVTMTTTPINESRCITYTAYLMYVLVLMSIWNAHI